MRVLHPWNGDDCEGAAVRKPAANGRTSPGGDERKPLPVHRLQQNRRSRPLRGTIATEGSLMRFEHHIEFKAPGDRVWAFLMDVPQMAACIPGASDVKEIDR